MTIFNLGSINLDHSYRVARLPAPGETTMAREHRLGLGGKGANQSVAAALAGARVIHMGAIGADGDWALEELARHGVETWAITRTTAPTAHAIINVDDAGENAIVVFPGANVEQSLTAVSETLSRASPADTLLLQNETNLQVEAANIARKAGIRVIYCAAPFEADTVREMLPLADLVVMNEVEFAQLAAMSAPDTLPDLVITRGAMGAEWLGADGERILVPAFEASPVDTTGAGDCFAGTLAAELDACFAPAEALRRASAAAALQVMRPGTADAMPTRREVNSFLHGISGT